MATVFEKDFILTPENEKTNVPLDFFVDEEFSRLEIFYSYYPKNLEDREKSLVLIDENIRRDAGENYSDYTEREEYLPLKNHITISLDSPLDYVGAAHRHGNNQHVIISEDFSSVGFEKTKIEKGKWVLTLNVHALITEKADFSVKIEGVTE